MCNPYCMEIFILYCIIILILHKFFIWKTNCITIFFLNYITSSCKCKCIRSLLYNYNFLFLDYILCFLNFNFHCINCFTWRSQYDDTIFRTLHNSYRNYCWLSNSWYVFVAFLWLLFWCEDFKNLEWIFFGKSLTFRF